MLIPDPPTIARVESISPSVCEAGLQCLARASWAASGDRSALPPNPRALLGIGVHGLFERATRSAIPGATEEQRVENAATYFDEEMERLFQNAHLLTRAKFRTREHIPFYNLYRARAATTAAQMPPTRSMRAEFAEGQGGAPTRLAESTLTSQDQVVRGRPDLIDWKNATVVDYKTGSVPDPQHPTESEARQLKLYAYLASENGIPVRKGVVERPNRVRAEMSIPRKDAEDEGRRAREVLKQLNQMTGRRFDEAASPSPKACRHCPCIPFCPAFWEASNPSWQDECGTHFEGIVESVDGEALMSLRLQVTRGTGTRGPGVVSRLSKSWLALEQTSTPEPGKAVRLTDARETDGSATLTEFRADRATTAVWTV